MKIVVGNKFYGDAPQELSVNRVSFYAQDGREMFEVTIIDEHSIEVRGICTCIADGVLYDDKLQIMPRASNVVTISASPYDMQPTKIKEKKE